MNSYPFKIVNDNDRYIILAHIENDDLFNKYDPLFKKYGFTGTGYTWEGFIILILKEKNPDILSSLEFDPEAGGFYVYTKSEKVKNKFIKSVTPIFSDLKILEDYIKDVDRNKIDD